MMVEEKLKTGDKDCLFFRSPVPDDGPEIHALLRRCRGLDINSPQNYLLLCEHFSSTCIVVEQDSRVVAFISSYVLPERHDTLFIWQLAVDKHLRGQGLAKRLFRHLLSLHNLKRIRYVEAMLNPCNKVAQPLFESLAKQCHCDMSRLTVYPASMFGNANHGEEHLVRVGPIGSVSKTMIGRR
jgi:L-2,4-diaminobutyric acid acetyltransferase